MPIWAINLIIGLVFQVASTLLQMGQDSAKKQEVSGYRGQYSTGGVNPKSFVVGTFGLAGKLEYENSYGADGGTPNAYYVWVISFGDIPIDSLTSVFVNTLDTGLTTTGHTEQGYPVPEYADGGRDHLWWEFYDGTQTTASDFLVSKFSADADRPWTEQMVGRGVPYVTLTARQNKILWPGFPKFMLQVQGIRLYDVRKDTTQGGVGSHRVNDPSTWEFSDNPVVFIYNAWLGIRYNGEWMWGRKSPIHQSRLPYAVWAAAMDVCDEEVDLVGGGTERRFRFGREIKVSQRPIDVINEALVACNGAMTEAAGVFYIFAGEAGDSVVTISDTTLVVSESSDMDPFPQSDKITNGATATYLEPAQAWESKDADPFYDQDLEDEDLGQRNLAQLRLECVFSGTQVQRLLRSKVLDSRRMVKHILPLPPVYDNYRCLQTLTWNSEHNGYSGKKFQIITKATRPDGIVLLGVREIEPADHSWVPGTDERAIVFAPTTPIVPSAQILVGWYVTPTLREDDDGNQWLPTGTMHIPGGLEDVRAIAVEVRESWIRSGNTEKSVVFTGETPYDVNVELPEAEIPVSLQPRKTYEFRGRPLPFSGRVTRWSNQDIDGVDGPWLSATMLNVPSLPPGSVEAQTLSQDLQNITGPLIGDLFTAISDIQEQIGDVANVVADNMEIVLRQITGVSARTNSAAAAVLRVETVILGPGSAFAALEEQVAAVVENIYADGLWKMVADVNLMTGTVTLSAVVKAGNGVFADEAALRLGAEVDGLGSRSYIQMMADTLSFITVDGDFVSEPFAIEADFVKITTLRFEHLMSIDGETIEFNGISGYAALAKI